MTLIRDPHRGADVLFHFQIALSKLAGALIVSFSILTMHAASLGLCGEQKASGRADPKVGAGDTKDARGDAEKARAAKAKAKARAESVAALLSHLGLGEGSAIADIGAGNGQDSWTFASIVGKGGTVFAEEIAEKKVKSLEKQAAEKDLPQVRAVLGQADDPCLPSSSVDLAFVRYVYHHFAKPREMLRGIWRSLKPGGYFVVIDRHRGTLQDWVPREQRGEKHFWIAETTVVREAREEGFDFVECADELWHENEPFVLIFKRPAASDHPAGDPDPFLSLALEPCCKLLVPDGRSYQRPVFIALGESRELIPLILQHSSGQGLDVVLEEWATRKEERPSLPPDIRLPSVLTENGDPHLGSEPIDVVFFLDSYHLLFHGKTLLGKIRESLSPNGYVYVLDREAKEPLCRREASHHRRIEPETVKQEMADAGFKSWSRGPPPSPDRFLLVFGKAQPKSGQPEADRPAGAGR